MNQKHKAIYTVQKHSMLFECYVMNNVESYIYIYVYHKFTQHFPDPNGMILVHVQRVVSQILTMPPPTLMSSIAKFTNQKTDATMV